MILRWTIRIAILVMIVACALTSAETSQAAGVTQLARIVAPTPAMTNPGFGDRVWTVPVTPVYGDGQMQLRVLGSVPGEIDPATGVQRTYYHVALPIRPNGTTGWIASDTVQITTTPYLVNINRAKRTLTLMKNGKKAGSWSVVVGRPTMPTPKGLFQVQGKNLTGDSFDGAAILPFAYSNVLQQFQGGPGRVAMHGRSGASFNDPLGTARSHGCVRMNNNHILYLAKILPIGTPVNVV